MVVLQGQGSAQMERLVYGDNEQLIREYMLCSSGQRSSRLFQAAACNSARLQRRPLAYNVRAARPRGGDAGRGRGDVEAPVQPPGVKSRLTESGLRELV